MTASLLAPRVEQPDLGEAVALWEGDVIVVGGGSAGCAAALAAARHGARTLLIDPAGFLGGIGSAVLDTFYGFFAPGAEDRTVGGIGWEVASRLLDAGTAFLRPNTYGAGTGVTYEPDELKALWDSLMADAGVTVLLYTSARAVVMTEDRVEGVVVETRAGSGWLRAHTVIDASGDAEIAWRAGAPLEVPSETNRVQPLTMTFRIGGVDESRYTNSRLHELMREAAAEGSYRLPRREGSVHRTLIPGVVHTNLTRVSGIDPTDPFALSAAEAEGRRQVFEYLRFLQDRAPGFEDSYLAGIASRIGVRETRRLVGQYVLQRDDVLEARRFSDEIALCGAPVEDHDGGDSTLWAYVGGEGPSAAVYGVPLRTLLPQNVAGLIVAGRCLSATHDAHASVRSIAQCMATGQAAGTAAAIAASSGIDVSAVDAGSVRSALLDAGAVL